MSHATCHKAHEKGFTLVELLVSIAIVGLMATVTVVNFRAGQKEDALKFAVNQMAADMRTVETAALTGARVEGEEPNGYGLHFEAGESDFSYFIDQAGDEVQKAYNAGDTEVRTFFLPQGIRIFSLQPAGSSLDLFFVQPRPTVFVNGATSEAEARIELKHKDIAETKTIVINRISGKIDVE